MCVNQGGTIITATHTDWWSCRGIRTFLPLELFLWDVFTRTFLWIFPSNKFPPGEFPPHTNPWLYIELFASICNQINCKFLQKDENSMRTGTTMDLCTLQQQITKSLTAAMSKQFIRMPVAICRFCYNIELNVIQFVCSWCHIPGIAHCTGIHTE